MNETVSLRRHKAAQYFLIGIIFSFAGWLMETIHVSDLAGELVDRGFLFLPLCPIYGSCLMALYFLLGTPSAPHGILKNTTAGVGRYLLYVLFAGLVPTLAELAVGAFFHQLFDIRLWSYEHQPFNFMGYICLPISVTWAVAITVLMQFIFPLIHKLVGKLSQPVRIAAPLAVAIACDFLINFILILL